LLYRFLRFDGIIVKVHNTCFKIYYWGIKFNSNYKNS